MQETYCPACDAMIEMEDPHEGDVIECPECGVELEVIETGPLEVDFPFDDDWDDEWEEEEDY